MLFNVCSTYAQVIPRNVQLLYEHTSKNPPGTPKPYPSILVAPDKFSMFRWHFRRTVEAWSSLRPVQPTLVTRLPSMVLLNLLCSVCVCVCCVCVYRFLPKPWHTVGRMPRARESVTGCVVYGRFTQDVTGAQQPFRFLRCCCAKGMKRSQW